MAGLLGSTPRIARVGIELSVPLRACFALSVVSGVMWFLAFFGPDIWPFSLIALAPLIVALEGQTPGRCLILGSVAGFTQSALTFHWIYSTALAFTGFSGPLCAAFAIFLYLYQGGRLAAVGWLYSRARLNGWPRSPTFAVVFVAADWAYPLLLPCPFGGCAHTVPCLMQSAEWGGPCLVGLVLLAPNLAIATMALDGMRRCRIHWQALAWLALPLAAAVHGRERIRNVEAIVEASPSVRAGMVQPNIPRERTVRSVGLALQRYLTMSAELRQSGVDFLVWSEGMISVAEDTYTATLPSLFTRQLGVPAIFGMLLSRETEGKRVSINSALAMQADGRIVGRRDKHLLFPFGEYLPLGDVFPQMYRWVPNAGRFVSGTEEGSTAILGHNVATVICYEDMFSSVVDQAIRTSNAELIVSLSNDIWFGDSSEPWGHLAEAKFRAVEHRMYLLRATNSGVSAVIDPAGRVVSHTHVSRPETLDATIHWVRRTRTVYEILGDAPWWLASFVGFAVALVRRPRNPIMTRRASSPSRRISRG